MSRSGRWIEIAPHRREASNRSPQASDPDYLQTREGISRKGGCWLMGEGDNCESSWRSC